MQNKLIIGIVLLATAFGIFGIAYFNYFTSNTASVCNAWFVKQPTQYITVEEKTMVTPFLANPDALSEEKSILLIEEAKK
jgi:hypothetical protein